MSEVLCRKNKNWKAIYISIDADELDNLDAFVKKEVLSKIQKKDLKKWAVLDMVDTNIITTNFNSHTGKTNIELLIYVAGVGEKDGK